MNTSRYPSTESTLDEITDHLEDIRAMFRDQVHITIIVRNEVSVMGSRDVLVTDDDPEVAITAIRQQVESKTSWRSGPEFPVILNAEKESGK